MNPNDNVGIHKKLDFECSELPNNEKLCLMLEDFKKILN